MVNQPQDITVIGAGFVGMAFAIAAARHGFEVSVHDQKPEPVMPADASANVIAVNPASRQFLEDLGAWLLVPETHRTPYSAMQVVDGTGTGSIHFDATDAGLPELGHIVNQAALLAALGRVADRSENITMNWQNTIDADTAGGLLVAADGAHSKTREALGIRKISWPYDQTATVCLAQFEQPHGRVARQWFHEQGPVALLPVDDPHTVAVVWSCFEPLHELADGAFRLQLAQAVEEKLGPIAETGPRFSFPLIQQHALQYVRENVALLGDAAHAIHPLAGQGANLGFADARDLAMEIGSARLEGRSPGDLVVLKRFQRRRQPENHAAGLAMEGFHRMFTSSSPLVALIRNQGLRFVDDNQSLKRLAISVATGRF